MKNLSENDKTEKFFNNSLSNYEEEPSLVVWERIEKQLDKKSNQRSKIKKLLTQWAVAASILIAFSFAAIVIYKSAFRNDTTDKLVENKNTENALPISPKKTELIQKAETKNINAGTYNIQETLKQLKKNKKSTNKNENQQVPVNKTYADNINNIKQEQTISKISTKSIDIVNNFENTQDFIENTKKINEYNSPVQTKFTNIEGTNYPVFTSTNSNNIRNNVVEKKSNKRQQLIKVLDVFSLVSNQLDKLTDMELILKKKNKNEDIYIYAFGNDKFKISGSINNKP